MGAGRIDTSGIVGKQRFPATLARRAGTLTGALLAASVAFNAADAATSSEFWRSRGYGLVATVVNGKSAFYDVTQTTCVAQKIYDSAGIFDHATWSAGRLRATVISPWGLTIWQFDRIAALPAPCVARAPDADSPVYNFEVFWKTFDEQYAYLKQRGVDWKVIGENYRAKVTTLTTDAELLEVFRSMLRQLQDRHTMIIAGAARINDAIPDPIAQWYADFDRAPTGDRDDVTKNKLVEYLSPSWKRYLDPDSIRRVSSNVTTATTHDGRVGYLSIAAESGYARSQGGDDDVSAARKELEQVFSGFRDVRGLIVDLRLNQGGSDEVSLIIAGLLTSTDRPGFSKCARDGGAFTVTQHTRIRRSAHAFTGSVIIITSPMTASAAENIAMMVKDFPNVLVVGDRTAGVHSDPLIKTLPNGWRFTVSNEAFTAPDGFDYEAIGTQPHLLVPFELERVRRTGVDAAMEKSLGLLASNRFADLVATLKSRLSRGRSSLCR